MFVRRKKNRSGTTSIIVVDKSKGKFTEVIIIGVGETESEIEALCVRAKKWIDKQCCLLDIFEQDAREREEKQVVGHLLSNVEIILINGEQLILNRVFQSIGFDALNDDILKHLVVARLSQPMSKAATVDYLKSHFNEDVKLHKIY